jgi:hypothetical protein
MTKQSVSATINRYITCATASVSSAAEAQARRTDHQAEQHGGDGRKRHRGPDVETEIEAQHRGGVAAEAEQRHLRQRKHAGETEQQVPLRGDDGIEQAERDLTDHVAAVDIERQCHRSGEDDETDREVGEILAFHVDLTAVALRPGRTIRRAGE